METNSANHPMNHLVTLQVRRRLAAGLAAQLSYTWQKNITGNRLDFHLPLLYLESNGVPHAIQALWSYDIPVGRGKRYGANMNAWEDGDRRRLDVLRHRAVPDASRSSSATPCSSGMTAQEAQKALQRHPVRHRTRDGAVTVFNFPEDIYTNTRLAYNTDETYPNYYAPGTEPNGSAGDREGRTARTGTSRRRAARAATSSSRAIAARRTFTSSAAGSGKWTSVWRRRSSCRARRGSSSARKSSTPRRR